MNSSKIRLILVIFLALMSLPGMMVISVAIGDMNISLSNTAKAILNGLGLSQYPIPLIESGIIWQYRMSRALMAACSGGGLALCGIVLQALLRNPLAEPYLLGISAGASTGAVSVMLLGLGGGVITIGGGAFLGACFAFTIIIVLSRGLQDHPVRIILAGVAGTQLFNAVTACVISTSANAEQSRSVMFWLLGSLSGVRWPDALLGLSVTLIGLGIILCYARTLDTFSFGEEISSTLGTNITRVRVILLLVTAFITAAIVSTIGAVGFVGLVIPHITRMLIKSTHLLTIPVSFLLGAHFMMAADIFSRTLIQHQVIPIGVVTALVGAPVFAIILFNHRQRAI
ncbi:FecCD family ABC transporter permease [Klebsiella pneumoniae]|uniref:FecCD family ABC transporter permease n=1 Tax=Klebsiella pneumoniae TaxID=573 RepID=UPI0029624840|nr:iron chelate uptake ABC transporter family permease subunit [Klebsiella pneumoniae]MDW1257616.1 iron chelate uptake ABC transporter family permease subunit [Klebsiella pneumoniae]